MRRYLIGLAAISGLAFATPAMAIVVSGGISVASPGGGAFTELTVPFTESSPNNTVGADNFNDQDLYAFNEDQNITTGAVLNPDVGAAIAAGTEVASHYVFFDPPQTNPLSSQTGFVTFDSAVLGIFTSKSSLDSTDFLANNSVTYLSPTLRGLESGDTVSINGVDPNRIDVTWTAGTPGDYIRVLTERSPGAIIPVPAGAPLLLTGLALLGFLGRRRRG